MTTFTLSTHDEIGKELGRRLRAQRLVQHMSQEELAGRAGASKSTIKAIELQGQASLASLLRVIVALGLVDDLKDAFKIRVTSIADMEQAQTAPRKRAPRRAISK